MQFPVANHYHYYHHHQVIQRSLSFYHTCVRVFQANYPLDFQRIVESDRQRQRLKPKLSPTSRQQQKNELLKICSVSFHLFVTVVGQSFQIEPLVLSLLDRKKNTLNKKRHYH